VPVSPRVHCRPPLLPVGSPPHGDLRLPPQGPRRRRRHRQRRSSDDVSVVTYLLFLLGQVIWLTYGVRFGLLEIVLGMSANLAGNLSVILSALRFRTRTA
jgi:hypothetical protein